MFLRVGKSLRAHYWHSRGLQWKVIVGDVHLCLFNEWWEKNVRLQMFLFARRVNTVLKHWNESYGETTNEVDDDDRLTWWRQGQLQKTEKGTWLLICSIMEMLTPTILNEPFLSLAFQQCYYHESCIFPFILIDQTCHFNPFSTPFCFFSR